MYPSLRGAVVPYVENMTFGNLSLVLCFAHVTFPSTVNDFLPFISEEIVDAMRNGVPSMPTTVEKNQGSLGPLLVHGIEPER